MEQFEAKFLELMESIESAFEGHGIKCDSLENSDSVDLMIFKDDKFFRVERFFFSDDITFEDFSVICRDIRHLIGDRLTDEA